MEVQCLRQELRALQATTALWLRRFVELVSCTTLARLLLMPSACCNVASLGVLGTSHDENTKYKSSFVFHHNIHLCSQSAYTIILLALIRLPKPRSTHVRRNLFIRMASARLSVQFTCAAARRTPICRYAHDRARLSAARHNSDRHNNAQSKTSTANQATSRAMGQRGCSRYATWHHHHNKHNTTRCTAQHCSRASTSSWMLP